MRGVPIRRHLRPPPPAAHCTSTRETGNGYRSSFRVSASPKSKSIWAEVRVTLEAGADDVERVEGRDRGEAGGSSSRCVLPRPCPGLRRRLRVPVRHLRREVAASLAPPAPSTWEPRPLPDCSGSRCCRGLQCLRGRIAKACFDNLTFPFFFVPGLWVWAAWTFFFLRVKRLGCLDVLAW